MTTTTSRTQTTAPRPRGLGGRWLGTRFMPGLVAGLAASTASAAAQDIVRLPLEGVRDLTSEGRATVELTCEQAQCYVGEPFQVRVRFGFEPDFLETNVLQLFRQQLDLPAQLLAGWLDEIADVTELPLPAPTGMDGSPGPSFALNDRLARARVVPPEAGAGGMVQLEIERRYLPQRAGRIELEGPALRFAYATRFDDDLIVGRVAADREDGFVRAAALAIDVLDLPSEGQPFDFGGAVGSFALTAEARTRNLRVGESFQLDLHFASEGHLDGFEPPRLDRLEGLRTNGFTESQDAGVRTVTYDLVPTSAAVREVPEISWSYFDPNARAYITLRTEPIEVSVRPGAAGADDASAPEENRSTPAPDPVPSLLSRTLPLLAGGAVLVGVLALLARRKQHAS